MQRALPNTGAVDLNDPTQWGAIGGTYNKGLVVQAELGTKVALTSCSGVMTLALPFLELPLAVDGAIDAADSGGEIWDWTRKQ